MAIILICGSLLLYVSVPGVKNKNQEGNTNEDDICRMRIVAVLFVFKQLFEACVDVFYIGGQFLGCTPEFVQRVLFHAVG